MLGQVAGAAENSNNQPNPLKQNSTPSFTKITKEYKLPYLIMFIKGQQLFSQIAFTKNIHLNLFMNAPMSSSATFSSTLLPSSPPFLTST
jgi:hypothetical protein